jgi:hypothetical protein
LLLRRALLTVLLLGSALLPRAAFAQRESTRGALFRLEELMAMRLEDSGNTSKELSPAIVVSVRPAFEETLAWYPNAALSSLVRVFGSASLRSCEACMAPRTWVEDGQMELVSSGLTTDEIVRLDERFRNDSPPARTAIWLDETTDGVSLRVIDLRNGRILVADNFDANLDERTRTTKTISLTRELERRVRGEGITHTFVDMTMYPGQHFSLDWTEQWGDRNANLSGLSVSLFDPVLGVGGTYVRAVPSARNLLVGGKVLMSLPSAAVTSITGENTEVIDPLLTGVFVVRYPIGSSNYGVSFTASTNGRVGVGISLLNSSFLPFLP